MNLLFEYIKYRWNSRGRHGIHSPFVYDFVDKCLPIDVSPQSSKELKAYSNRLKNDSRTIEIFDAGVGSKHLGTQRKVKDVFKISSSKGKYGLLLYRLVHFYQPKEILEFGTSLGVGTFHLAYGNSKCQITTVEACPQTFNCANEQLQLSDISNVKTVNTTFQAFLTAYSGPRFDLVFVDGHHDGTALLSYMDQLKAHTHSDTIFVLDDIRWSDSMYQAFQELVKSADFHVSMDLFRVGILVPRPQQVKEHFVVKL